MTLSFSATRRVVTTRRVGAAFAAALWIPLGAGMAQAADDRFADALGRIPVTLWDAQGPHAFVTYVDFEALADVIGLDLSEAWPTGEADEEAEMRARPFLMRGLQWQPPVTELWTSREEPLAAFGLSLAEIGRMAHIADRRDEIGLSLLAGAGPGLPMPSVEDALAALGYTPAPQEVGPWWSPPNPLPQALPGALMAQPFAATQDDALVLASRPAAQRATAAGDAPSLADDPDFAAAVAAAGGRAPVLQAFALPGVLFADPPDFVEDMTEGDLPPFRLVLFTEHQQGNRAESRMILVYPDEQDAARAHDELTVRWDGPLAERWLRELADVAVRIEDPVSQAAGLWTVRIRAINTVDPDDLSALPRTAYAQWLQTILVNFDLHMLWP